MKKRKNSVQQDELLDEQIRMAYGFSDRQLEQEMDYAIAHPDTSPRLKAPDDEFQRIMDKVVWRMTEKADRTSASASSHSSDYNSDSEISLPGTNPSTPPDNLTQIPPPRRPNWKKFARAAAIAIVVGVVGVNGVVSTVGRSGYKYGEGRSGVGDNVRAWNNVPASVEEEGEIEKAYNEMQRELDIPILRLKYVPANMVFDDWTLENGRAIIKFNYNGYVIWLVEVEGSLESFNTYVSDREEYDKKFNRLLGTDVILSKNDLDSGLTEYSAEIETNIAYYYLSGIMEEDEFTQIVEQMYFVN
ncbi:MAG TPA: DUF4367 domain-containing protein [Candidatus Lachnoclostridium avicola]|nr:DUF4367 domain-containing protein [Candidatus Lachnoclostridium avicola]